MKIVFTQQELDKELKTLKKGEEILLYERGIESRKDQMEFSNYLSHLILISRSTEIKITGAISFKLKEEKKR